MFTVLLPVAGTEAQTTPVETKAAAPTGNGHILLVDDEEPIARVLEAFLVGLGYDVTVKTDSTETLAAFVDDPERYDLVITDMTMPAMTGDELSKKIREIRPDVPIVICTGFSEKFDEKQANRFGINGFVTKPVDRVTPAQTVQSALAGGKVGHRP